jgi:hypothetical protein
MLSAIYKPQVSDTWGFFMSVYFLNRQGNRQMSLLHR